MVAQEARTKAGSPAAGRARAASEGGVSRGPIEALYAALASQRTTSLLVIVLAGLVALTAIIPQGRDALVIAEHPQATTMHALVRWGLTEVFDSAWVKALAVLLAANLFAIAVSSVRSTRSTKMRPPPENAEHRTELSAPLPELAVEALRENFRARLGSPRGEEVRGSRVTMLFDTNRGGRLASMLAHVGLGMLVAGAGLASRPLPDNRLIVKALLDVKDSATGFVGSFDMASGEQFEFFRFPGKYSIVQYVPSKLGLGPAIRIHKRVSSQQDQSRNEDFWVFLNAPPGFDEKHRKGEVSIVARKMGLVPLPGSGVTSSSSAVFLVFGFGVLFAGVFASRRSEGRVWVDVDGDRVTISGQAREPGDEGFARTFSRLVVVAGRSIAEE